MKRNSIMAAAIAATFLVPAIARAQPATEEPVIVKAATETNCELHVWPGENFSSQTIGFFGAMGGAVGYGLNAAIHDKDNRNRRAQIADALSGEGQVSALKSLNLPELLGLPATNVIFHSETRGPAAQKAKGRIAESESDCYSEVLVGVNSYTKAVMAPRMFTTEFIIREFGKMRVDPIRYRLATVSGLRFFPPKEEAEFQPAFDELRAAFRQNFTFFAAKASKKLRSKRAKLAKS